jgi:YD repeat-containing protein
MAESYTYDLVGNLLSKIVRKNSDDSVRLRRALPAEFEELPGFDERGVCLRPCWESAAGERSDGDVWILLRQHGRLIGTSTQYSYLPALNFQNAYTYDAASNRTSLTAPDGSISTYGYDTLNRLNGLAKSWAGSFGFSYDALSRRTSLTRPNGVNTSYSYDSVSHLLSVLHQAGRTRWTARPTRMMQPEIARRRRTT